MKKITKILMLVMMIALCFIIMTTSKQHKQIMALEKENDELSIAVKKKKATVKQISVYPTQYEIASSTYGVDKNLLEAIERLETGHFTSDVFKEKNNAYGGKVNDEYLSYDSHFQSTMELARLLRFSYYNKGIIDLNEIGKTYCPDDYEWAQKVRKIYEELKDEKI